MTCFLYVRVNDFDLRYMYILLRYFVVYAEFWRTSTSKLNKSIEKGVKRKKTHFLEWMLCC